MSLETALLPQCLQAIAATIRENAEEVTALDQIIGDGDHVINLQRGIAALLEQSAELAGLDWPDAWQKIGMTLMTTVGGASGSLFGTLFVAMSKAARGPALSLQGFTDSYGQGVEAVKKRGRSDVGEKTMLDVLVPVAEALQRLAAADAPLATVLDEVVRTAEAGAESTRGMVPTKGRASFLGERAKDCMDPGAKTSQLMIAAVVGVLRGASTA